MDKATKIAIWIWFIGGLDPAEESWQGLMIDDVIKKLEKILAN